MVFESSEINHHCPNDAIVNDSLAVSKNTIIDNLCIFLFFYVYIFFFLVVHVHNSSLLLVLSNFKLGGDLWFSLRIQNHLDNSLTFDFFFMTYRNFEFLLPSGGERERERIIKIKKRERGRLFIILLLLTPDNYGVIITLGRLHFDETQDLIKLSAFLSFRFFLLSPSINLNLSEI